jgi:hypothetical protein
MRMMEKQGQMSHAERLQRMRSARDELEKVTSNERFFLVINQEVPQTAREVLRGSYDMSSQRKGRETARLLLDSLKTI